MHPAPMKYVKIFLENLRKTTSTIIVSLFNKIYTKQVQFQKNGWLRYLYRFWNGWALWNAKNTVQSAWWATSLTFSCRWANLLEVGRTNWWDADGIQRWTWHFCFIDFKKAFNHEILLKILRNSRIRIGDVSSEINIRKAVQQGLVLSPFAIQYLFKQHL